MLKKKRNLYFVFLIFIYVLTSCSGELIQKAYLTNPPNVSVFDTAKVLKMKFAGNFRYFENQVSYSFTRHWGLASNLFFGYHLQYGGDLGVVYYNRFKRIHYFEISSGYGYFNANSHMTQNKFLISGVFSNPYGKNYKHTINSTYHKLFFQPSYFIFLNIIDIGMTLRVSLPYFTDYDCSYSIMPISGEYNYPPWEFAEAKFKNKFGFTLEPMFTIKFKTKKVNMFLQLGMCFSKDIVHKVDSIHIGDVDNYGTPYPYYKNYQPLHADLFMNYGIEFNIRTRKKDK